MGRDVRTAIIEATERLTIERGFAGATTKEVARAAGCSEGSIYNHFEDRTDLLAQVVAARMTSVMDELSRVPGMIGEAGQLDELLAAVLGAYGQLIALSTALFADPQVVARFNAVLGGHGVSPDGIRGAVAQQLGTAQAGGSLRDDVDAGDVATLICGACHEAALHRFLAGLDPMVPRADARRLAATFEVLLRST